MDEPTREAFTILWTIWKQSQDFEGTEAQWNGLLEAAEAVYNTADNAIDPDFIRDFCRSVISSVQRIYKKKH